MINIFRFRGHRRKFIVLINSVLSMFFIAANLLVMPDGFAAEESRHLIIVVDTSGSMSESDPAKYAVQSVKILNDILKPQDQLSLIRFPRSRICSAGGSSLTINRNNTGFSKNIESHVGSGGGYTTYAESLRNAQLAIKNEGKDHNLLVLITDEGAGHFGCGVEANLLSSMQSNTHRAGVNIGGGNINSNNDFDSHYFAKDSPTLIAAIANIYQKFIGGKRSQNGRMTGSVVKFDIDNYVKTAYLVVAADGDMGPIAVQGPTSSNSVIDLNYRQGATAGYSSGLRKYKIIRLQQPSKGEWEATVDQLQVAAGWMLIQEYSIGVRFAKPSIANVNEPLELVAELYDETTNQAIPIADDMALSIKFKNQQYEFNRRGDNFVTTISFADEGEFNLVATLRGGEIEKNSMVPIEVIKPAWKIEADVAPKITVDTPTLLRVRLQAIKQNSRTPETVNVQTPEGSITLQLSKNSKTSPEYEAWWTPVITGEHTLTFSIAEQYFTQAVEKRVVALGYVRFGPPIPIDFGTLSRHSEAERILDLNATVRGTAPITLELSLDKSNVQVYRKVAGEWLEMSANERVVLNQHQASKWPVKIVAHACPEQTLSLEDTFFKASHTLIDGKITSVTIPFTVTITPDHWFICWWPTIALIILALMILKAIHCYFTTAKFPAQFGLMLSDDIDFVENGSFHPIRLYRASKRRFCQDAYIYLFADFRWRRKSDGAWVRLQARSEGVFLQTTENGSVYRSRHGSEWEKLEDEGEIPLRPGTIYKNSEGSIFFEAKHK